LLKFLTKAFIDIIYVLYATPGSNKIFNVAPVKMFAQP